jgi:hypothetical protein
MCFEMLISFVCRSRWLRIFSSGMTNELTGCDDCGSCGVQTILDAELPAGNYALVVEGWSTSTGEYVVAMHCTTPNASSSSNQISGFVDGNTSCGTTVRGSTAHAGSHVGNGASDHIYYFALNDTQSSWDISFNSCASSFDTWLRIFDLDLQTELAGCDDCVRFYICALPSGRELNHCVCLRAGPMRYSHCLGRGASTWPVLPSG